MKWMQETILKWVKEEPFSTSLERTNSLSWTQWWILIWLECQWEVWVAWEAWEEWVEWIISQIHMVQMWTPWWEEVASEGDFQTNLQPVLLTLEVTLEISQDRASLQVQAQALTRFREMDLTLWEKSLSKKYKRKKEIKNLQSCLV